jgi:hypothetical protein
MLVVLLALYYEMKCRIGMIGDNTFMESLIYIDGLLPNKIIIGDLAPIDLLALAKNYFYLFFG